MLEANMQAIQAEERLRDRGHELSAEGLRNLVLETGAGEDVADDAYCARIQAEARNG